jgi:hypothetical protein
MRIDMSFTGGTQQLTRCSNLTGGILLSLKHDLTISLKVQDVFELFFEIMSAYFNKVLIIYLNSLMYFLGAGVAQSV